MDGGWGYLVGSAVTIAGLFISQLVVGRREERRWKAERAAEDLRWRRESERHDALVKREARDRWADERRKVYAEFLTVTRAWVDLVRDDLEIADLLGQYLVRSTESEHRRKTRELLADLELWAPGSIHLRGRKLLFALEWADMSIAADLRSPRPAVVPLGEGDQLDKLDLRQLVASAKSAYQRTLSEMRDDLGLLSPQDAQRRDEFLERCRALEDAE